MNREIVKNLILMINNTKKFDSMDIDNESFINYICDMTGMQKDYYMGVMGLADPLTDDELEIYCLTEYENGLCSYCTHSSECNSYIARNGKTPFDTFVE